MLKKCQNIINPKFFIGFCVLELLVLITLKTVQMVFPTSIADTFLMFIAIVFNTICMLFLVSRVKKAGKDTALYGIPLAIFLTFLADCFLVLAYDLSEAGVINFISVFTCNMFGFFIFGLVQIAYAYYLGITKRRLIIRIGFYLVFLAVIAILGLLTWDRFVACVSMSQLILNVVYAWIEYKKKNTKQSLLLALGITLFLGCDALIMMRMLLPKGGIVYAIIAFMVWVFYIPSQVVLTSSYLVDRIDA